MIKSPDEYTVVVETPRGPKDFQYDQVFTPDHGQEKVFEDTNVSTTVSIQMCCLRERLLIYLFTIRAQLFTENENDFAETKQPGVFFALISVPNPFDCSRSVMLRFV